MGVFTRVIFEAGGVPHELILAGRHYADTDRIAADLAKICDYQIRLFGGEAPFDRYLFLTAVVGDGFGGLEHRASTALLCGRGDLISAGQSEITDGYRTFLSLCSHEYFHSWNVKRIKPAEFSPYRLDREVYTRQLWAYEGITSYYDELCLARSRVIDDTSYLDLLAKGITRVLRGPGRLKQTLAESSFTAWTKFYQQDENAANAIVSYYTKGALFALALDLTIRQHSHQRLSLDNVMGELWQRHGLTGIGTQEDSVLAICNELLGEQLDEFFDRYLHTTDGLPLEKLLSTVGIELTLRHSGGQSDSGGKVPATLHRHHLGARYEAQPLGIRLLSVLEGGAAWQAGLAAGDRLIAIDGLEISATTVESLLERLPTGNSISVHGFRRDELFCKTLQLEPGQPDTVTLTIADAEQAKAWLRGADD